MEIFLFVKLDVDVDVVIPQIFGIDFDVVIYANYEVFYYRHIFALFCQLIFSLDNYT